LVPIFEGTDLVGKATLARHYAQALGFPIVKLRWDLKAAEAETIAFAKATIGLLAAIDADVILDRSFLSMWAYEEDAAYMEPLIVGLRHVLGAHLVVLTTDPPVLKDRYEAHPDRYFSASRVLAANERFTRLPLLMPPEGEDSAPGHRKADRRAVLRRGGPNAHPRLAGRPGRWRPPPGRRPDPDRRHSGRHHFPRLTRGRRMHPIIRGGELCRRGIVRPLGACSVSGAPYTPRPSP
jgi:hypothetical protein